MRLDEIRFCLKTKKFCGIKISKKKGINTKHAVNYLKNNS